MKRFYSFRVAAVLLCSTIAFAAQGASNNSAQERVLNQMDAAAAHFTTVQASFEWDQYTKVVDEHDTQRGTIYFRRSPKETQMAADITLHNSQPDKKYVLYTGNAVQVFQPRMDQITKYDVGKNKSEVESFLVLGFGGRGHDLLKSFDVRYLGTEKLGNVEAEKLELIPTSAAVRNNFNRIVLWFDPAIGVTVQQQFFSRSGDYRLTKYSNIKLHDKLSESIFKINRTSSTKVVTAR